jgi:hypothetical protein
MTNEDRYLAALHAMQSGVASEMNYPDTAAATEPKHLRVGINNALVQQTAIVKLLVEKNIITMDEYFKTLADEMEAEVGRYQDRVNERFGRPGVIKFR